MNIFRFLKKEVFTLNNLFSGRLNNGFEVSSIIGSGPLVTNKLKQLTMPELLAVLDRSNRQNSNPHLQKALFPSSFKNYQFS
jgi:hypothetical protein